MVNKFTIGLIYGRNRNWIAGTYYIENLIFALMQATSVLPSLKIYTEKYDDFEYLKKLTEYPDLKCIMLKDNQNLLDRAINKISYVLFKKHWIVKGIDNKVDVLFPADDTYYFDYIKNKIYWIPDFQEKLYPQYFSEKEKKRRDERYKKLIKQGAKIILSSNDALLDFNKYFSAENANTSVMPFAVTLPAFQELNAEEIKRKHGIPNQYFICSNQFWAHKNHQVILKSISKLKAKGIEIHVVFTGKMKDNRNPSYIDDLRKQISKYEIEDNVHFLGFVDRREQLVLMKKSIAIIQPSKFEGWSTVVEDAKALNHPIIVSELTIHREQLPGYKHFFKTNSPNSLIKQLLICMRKRAICPNVDYTKHIKKFGLKFMEILNEIND